MNARSLAKRTFVVLIFAGLLSGRLLHAQLVGDPFSGYTDTTSYFLDYSGTTSFASTPSGSSSDVIIDASIDGGSYATYNVDTGSRGLYVSSEQLPTTFIQDAPGPTYAGEIDLTSSKLVSSGTWVPTTVDLQVHPVINGVPSSSLVTVTSSVNVLDVTTLSAETGTSTFIKTTANSGTINQVNGPPLTIGPDPSGSGAYGVTLSGTEQVTYAANAGKLKDGSNFGIGFDLGSASGTGTSVSDNKNQIYNPLINIAGMGAGGSIVAGYVITPTGIQLGLATPTGSLTAGNGLNDKGYAYTSLNRTIYASTNSQPDWQTPLGQTKVNGVINGPGSVVLDSGIGDAYISAPGLTGADLTGTISVSLMNSEFAAGYYIDESNPNNDLNPSALSISLGGTTGIYSQNQAPYGYQYFNSGRNVFEAFNMLYDAQDGYMGVLPTAYGLTDPNVFFSAQAGGYLDPIPEPGGNSTALVLVGLMLALPAMRMFRGSQKDAKSFLDG